MMARRKRVVCDLHVRVTPEHQALLNRAADQADETVSEYVRRVLVRSLGEQTPSAAA